MFKTVLTSHVKKTKITDLKPYIFYVGILSYAMQHVGVAAALWEKQMTFSSHCAAGLPCKTSAFWQNIIDMHNCTLARTTILNIHEQN